MANQTYCKVALIGDSNVGKTQIANRLREIKFSDQYSQTLGAENVQISRLVELWDISSTYNYQTFDNSFIEGVTIVLLCCDLTNRDSLANLKNRLENFKEKFSALKPRIILVGTKADDNKRIVTDEQLLKFAENNNINQCFITSAKNDSACSITPNLSFEGGLYDFFNYIRVTTLNDLRTKIDALPDNDFKNSVEALYKHLEKKPNQSLLEAANTLLQTSTDLRANYKDQEIPENMIRKAFDTFEQDCSFLKECFDSNSKKLLKVIGICIITGIFGLLGMTVGAVLGCSVGILAGAWSGPGAAATGILGLFSGSVAGWAIGVAVASLVTGLTAATVTATASTYSLFKKTKTEEEILVEDIRFNGLNKLSE